jgi:protein-S-isoprenylcysteine O-methyltransferase Ste14
MSRVLGAIQSLLLAAFALIVWFDHSPRVAFGDPVLTVVGEIVALSGVLLIVIAIRTMGKAVQVEAAPREGAGLVTHGVYAKLRHPIYVGIAVTMLGFALRGITAAGLAVGAAALGFLLAKARYEETLLARRYPEYEAYRKTTLF